MKIEGPKKTDNSSAKDKAKSTSTGDTSFSSLITGGAGAPSGPAAAQSISSLDVLLAAQGAGDATEGSSRQKMVDRGERVLQILENMRMALLTGNISVGHLISLTDIVASHRENISDPELMAIIDEIDLRAQIELAKMARAYEQSRL